MPPFSKKSPIAYRVAQLIAIAIEEHPEDISEGEALIADLGLDDLSKVELAHVLEIDFDIKLYSETDWQTPGDVVQAVEQAISMKQL